MKNPLPFSIKMNWRLLSHLSYGSIALAALLLGITSDDGWEALKLSKFYYSLIFNVLMFLIVIIYISFVTFVLEQFFPRQMSSSTRWLLQALLGVFVAIWLAYILAIGYFKIGNVEFPDKFYFGTLFRIIVGLIFCGNAYFIYKIELLPLYMLKDNQLHDVIAFEYSETANTPFLAIPDDAAMIYSSGKGTKCISLDFTELHWSHSLESLMPIIDPENYLLVRRGLVVNKSIVDRIRKVPWQRKSEMVLKPGYEKFLETPLAIPRTKVTNAKEWLNKG